ncbi:hypothetical protein AMATHDRAFT_200539 [Amanita thiersii Skay4041]|uniref:Uncharacterized protein n=1 Tax=Amanita thiersii Skay4041 TaxID=703135 RepID=A0A2A9NB98_9AGAR|nr:hypothetical protein AMATHDRAFT_200539 [Amanita thiersii Skay4041]
MTTEELPFAGHPTIGSGWHLLTGEGEAAAGKTGTTLVTKAGKIPVRAVIKNGLVEKVGLSVPVDFKVHTPYAHPTLKKDQGELRDGDYLNGVEGKEAVASIVKGMTFILLALKSTEALGRMGGYTYRTTVPGLGEWDGMLGVYAFVILGEGEGVDGVDGIIYVQTRMFVGPLEDPATGSAASTLAGWLGIMKGKGKWAVEIVQGMEMGRRSEIGVVVDMGDEGGIRSIELVGSAVQVMEGYVYV